MYEINCFANRKYHYQTDLIKVPEPEKQDFIDDLFSNGNVCLTACKTEIVDPSYRPYLAVFSDGRFILSADHVRSMGIHDQHKVLDFRNRVRPDFVYLKGRIVPSDWVEEIYRRAPAMIGILPKRKLWNGIKNLWAQRKLTRGNMPKWTLLFVPCLKRQSV